MSKNFLTSQRSIAFLLVMSMLLTVSAFAAAPEDDIVWDYEADVVVVGAGGSGLPAALKALEDGASVLLVEANWDVGGHAAVSGGNLHSGGGTEIQSRYGIEDSADQYYTDHTSGITLATRFNDREVVRSVANSMAEAYAFLQEKGMKLRDEEPNRRNYVLDGFTEPESVARWTYADATGIDDPYTGRGAAGMGITRPLERTLRDNGAKFLLNYHMDKIIRGDNNKGQVLGVMASYTPTILPGETEPLQSQWSEGNIESTSEQVYVKANRGVIIATGGSTGNVWFRTMFDPRLGPELDGLSGMPFSDADASGELAAMEIGASLGSLAAFQQRGGHQITMANRFGCRYGYGGGYNEKSKIWKLVVANGIKPDYDSMIVVNMLGNRVGNEDKGAGGKYSYDSYEFFDTALSSVLIDEEGDGNARRYGGPLWAIFDQDAVERNEYVMEQGIVDFDNGYCFKADTLEELAEVVVNKYYEDIHMDPEILVETVERYNGFVEKGEDTDWGKKTLGYKIENGPFYAAWATPNLHDTYAGLRVAGNMQVYDIHGELIPNLFACGESSAGMRIHGFGRVMTSGYIAGRSAASTDEKGFATASTELNPEFAGTKEVEISPLEKMTWDNYVASKSDEPKDEEEKEMPVEKTTPEPQGDVISAVSPNGLNGPVKVTITVKDGKIVAIDTPNNDETPEIGGVAMETLAEAAIESQSAELDIISGATVSSKAFLEALSEAMEKAGL